MIIKRLLLSVSILLAGSTIYAQQGKLVQHMLQRRLDKDGAPNTGPAPDYSNLYFWAASPHKHDCADSIPSFLKGEKRDSSVDVFFIHPTTYIGEGEDEGAANAMTDGRKILPAMENAAWNADLSDTELNHQTDLRPILYQASVFNGSCRVFAPRYRQANLKAFIVRNSPRATEALDLAYGDVRAAFRYYLEHENHGRPIIIASHSQGSWHAVRLLKEFFDGKPLQRQLVCAYVVGHQIEKNAFQHIPFGDNPHATGCVVGWRSYQQGEKPRLVREENGNSLCVNPLTWTTAATRAPEEDNLGSMIGFNTIRPHAVGAAIEPSLNILWVSLPAGIGNKIERMKNLHILDYNLFWMNIRENVKERIAAYQQH